jgi:hypothetical protein
MPEVKTPPPTVLRRALTSLRPAYRRTSSKFGPAAAPGLLCWGGWHQLLLAPVGPGACSCAVPPNPASAQ